MWCGGIAAAPAKEEEEEEEVDGEFAFDTGGDDLNDWVRA
jgi:hypothetical protein